jgi:GT2 family glycosyltransferase
MEPGMRLGAFVITFRRPETLGRTLALVAAQDLPPAEILVVDNDPRRSAERVARKVGGRGRGMMRVGYHPMGGNAGPAGAAARGLAWGLDRGFDWILWLDDDDPPDAEDRFERLLRLSSGPEEDGETVGAVAASGVRWDWRRGRPTRLPDAALHGAVEIDAVAGKDHPIFRRGAVEATGLPEPGLFWGYEDYGYCLRVRHAGFRILCDGDLMRERRRRDGRTGYRPRRSAVPREAKTVLPRDYYTSRNYIHLMRHTFNRPDLARREAIRLMVKAAASWSRGPGFGAACTRLYLRAIRDGYRDRMGATLDLAGTKGAA